MKIGGEMADAEYVSIKGAHEFIKSVIEHGNNLHKFEEHINSVHNAVRTGSVGKMKGVIGKHIPKEGLFLINGLETKDYKIQLPFGLDDMDLDTTKLSMMECVCIFDKKKLFKYMIEELHLCHSRDFHPKRHN